MPHKQAITLNMQTQFLKYNYRITEQVRISVFQFLLKDARKLTNLLYYITKKNLHSVTLCSQYDLPGYVSSYIATHKKCYIQ